VHSSLLPAILRIFTTLISLRNCIKEQNGNVKCPTTFLASMAAVEDRFIYPDVNAVAEAAADEEPLL
jgi:hypothetical protein